MEFVHDKCEELHYKFQSVGQASYNEEPYEMSLFSIEKSEQNIYRGKHYHLLASIYVEAAEELQQQKNAGYKDILLRHVKSESILVRMMVLRAIRITNGLTSKDKCQIIIENKLFEDRAVLEQTKLLVKSIFDELSSVEKSELVDCIETLGQKEDKSTPSTIQMIWLSFWHGLDSNNVRINAIIHQIEGEYGGFLPGYQDSCDDENDDFEVIIDQSPLTLEELINMSGKDTVIYICNYKNKPFDTQNRFGLLKTLSEAVSTNCEWTYKLIKAMIANSITDSDFWQHVIGGISNANYTIEEDLMVLNALAKAKLDGEIESGIAYYYHQTIKKSEIRNNPKKYEDKLLFVWDRLVLNREHKKPAINSMRELYLNTTLGNLVYSLVNMLLYRVEKTIPKKYERRFEQVLKLRGWEKQISVFILVGHFNSLYSRNKDWCINRLKPFLERKNTNDFSSAWSGLLFFSRRIDKETSEVIEPLVYKVVKYTDKFDEDEKYDFIAMLVAFLIYVADNPVGVQIPAFYRYADERLVEMFIHEIHNRLMNMEQAVKTEWWECWLRHFLSNRKMNKPVALNEKENELILNLLPELDFVYEEAIEIICKGEMPNYVDSFFWYRLNEKKHELRPQEKTATLIIRLLNNVTSIGVAYEEIKSIVKDLNEITESQKVELSNALLNKGITL